jgi:multidrug efflux pump subunit AcrA (membrane-fusion protein)
MRLQTNTKKPLKWKAPIAVLIVSATLFAWMLFSSKPIKKTNIATQTLQVQASPIDLGRFALHETLYAQVTHPHISHLSAGVPGIIKKTFTAKGQDVYKNQELLNIDDQELLIAKEQTKAKMDQIKAEAEEIKAQITFDQQIKVQQKSILLLAKKKLKRQAYLFKHRATTSQKLETQKNSVSEQKKKLTQIQQKIDLSHHRNIQIKALLKQAELSLEQASIHHSRHQLRAPYAGKIIDVFTAPGQRITAQETLIKLYDPLRVELTATLPNRLIDVFQSNIQKNQAIQASNAANPQQTFVLKRLSAEVGRGELGQQAIFLPSHHQHLVLGQHIEIHAEIPNQSMIMRLPSQSLFDDNHIYLIQNNQLKRIKIQRVGFQKIAEHYYLLFTSKQAIAPQTLALAQPLPQATDGLTVSIEKTIHE